MLATRTSKLRPLTAVLSPATLKLVVEVIQLGLFQGSQFIGLGCLRVDVRRPDSRTVAHDPDEPPADSKPLLAEHPSRKAHSGQLEPIKEYHALGLVPIQCDHPAPGHCLRRGE